MLFIFFVHIVFYRDIYRHKRAISMQCNYASVTKLRSIQSIYTMYRCIIYNKHVCSSCKVYIRKKNKGAVIIRCFSYLKLSSVILVGTYTLSSVFFPIFFYSLIVCRLNGSYPPYYYA